MVFRENGSFERGDVAMSGEFFSAPVSGGRGSLAASRLASGEDDVLDAAGCYAIPGLIDIHLHGCLGHDFCNTDIRGIEKMARYQAANGVTAICPTTMTLPEGQLIPACERISAYRSPGGGAELAGIYLEGPFISQSKLGAQNPAYVRVPDQDMFHRLQTAAGGLAKIIAFAPEAEGAMEFIDAVREQIVCSLAHTAADYETSLEALRRGSRQVTHLYNAMPPFNHRDPGVIGAALDSPDCNVELICDDVHVHPSVVRATMRMFGGGRVIMVSDSMMATGLADGVYELGGQTVRVKGSVSRLDEGGAIAGSVTNLMDCVRTAVIKMDVPLAAAVKCASVNPAKAIGIFDLRGSIEPGKYADLVLLSEDLSIRNVFLKGAEIPAMHK